MVTKLGYSPSEVTQQLSCSAAAIHRRLSESMPLDSAPILDECMRRGLAEHDAWVAECREKLNSGKQKKCVQTAEHDHRG